MKNLKKLKKGLGTAKMGVKNCLWVTQKWGTYRPHFKHRIDEIWVVGKEERVRKKEFGGRKGWKDLGRVTPGCWGVDILLLRGGRGKNGGIPLLVFSSQV